MTLYKLFHSYITKIVENEEYTSSFLLGFYDSLSYVESRIDYYKTQPGFKDHPDGFQIESYEFENDLTEVYYVDHEYYLPEEGCDVITEIGLFATKKEAMQAVEYLRKENSSLFTFNAEGFVIEKYLVNESMWIEGFSSWETE